MLQLPGWFLRAGCAERSQPLVTENLAPDSLFGQRSKPFTTFGFGSDPIWGEGLSRLRLSGSDRILLRWAAGLLGLSLVELSN